MSSEKLTEEAQLKAAFTVVGELAALASNLDYQLNLVIVVILNLKVTTMLHGVVASLDVVRKVEILKNWADKIPDASLKKQLKKYARAIEYVSKYRNIAVHSLIGVTDGIVTLESQSTAKFLKSINLETNTRDRPILDDLKNSIKKGRIALVDGKMLLQILETKFAKFRTE
ncbi:MAG: hypothetical protein GY761_14205 [Hyphomicrobiales bacterium]|nr:hypothetical protein [Hyphomicrobiales bacterium]